MTTETAPAADAETPPLPATALVRQEFVRQRYIIDLADIIGPRPTEAQLLSPAYWKNFGPRLRRGDELIVRREPERDLILTVIDSYQDGGVVVRKADEFVAPEGRTHLCICRQGQATPENYTLLTHDGTRWMNGWAGSSNLRSIVAQIVGKYPGKDPSIWPDLTITHRAVTDLFETSPPASPADLAHTEPGANIMVLSPIGNNWPEDMWSSVIRMSGHTIPGPEKFRAPTIQNQVARFFFDGEPRIVGKEPRYREWSKTRLDQAGRDILLVRPDWRLAEILPESWPSPRPPVDPIPPEVRDQAERIEAMKQAKAAYRRQMQTKGFTWSPLTRSWRPPAKPE
jgi:hypothetical protein